MPRSRRASRKSWVAPAKFRAGQHRRIAGTLGRELLERGVEDPDVISGMVGASLAATRTTGLALVS